MSFLYHITAWPYQGSSALSPPSLESEGFVHLSSAEQLLRTAERWYAGHSEVGLLVLHADSLGDLRWEDLYSHGESFPHLYHAVPQAAVAAVARLAREGGRFAWPAALAGLRSPLCQAPDSGEAFIEPSRRFAAAPILPQTGVLTFFPATLERLADEEEVTVHPRPGSALGPDHVLVLDQRQIAVCAPGYGAPLAAVAVEEMIALGCRRFVVCGGAGGLSGQPLSGLVLVSEALRDEGLSHHYLPAAERVASEPEALGIARSFLDQRVIPHQVGATWTTDALYRETPARIARRREQGCLTVEMEVAAMLAVAQHRGVPLVPLLSCGDDLSGDSWDFRDWTEQHGAHDKLLWLALDLAARLGR